MTVRASHKQAARPRPVRTLGTTSSPPPSLDPVGSKSPRRPVTLVPPHIPHVRQAVVDPGGGGRVRCEFIYPGDRLQHAVTHCPRPVLDLVDLAARPVDITCEFGGAVRRKLPAYYYASDKRRPSTCSDDTRQTGPTPRPDGRRRVLGPPVVNRSARPGHGHRLSPRSVSEVPAAGHDPPPPTPVLTEKRGGFPPAGNASAVTSSPRRRSSVPVFNVTEHSAKSSVLTTRRNSLYVTDHSSTTTTPIARRNLRH